MTPYERERNLTEALCHLYSMRWIKTRSTLDRIVKIRWVISIFCLLASIIWTQSMGADIKTRLLFAGIAIGMPQIFGALLNVSIMDHYPMPHTEAIKRQAGEMIRNINALEKDTIESFDDCVVAAMNMDDDNARKAASKLDEHPELQRNELLILIRDVLH